MYTKDVLYYWGKNLNERHRALQYQQMVLHRTFGKTFANYYVRQQLSKIDNKSKLLFVQCHQMDDNNGEKSILMIRPKSRGPKKSVTIIAPQDRPYGSFDTFFHGNRRFGKLKCLRTIFSVRV